MFIYLLLHYFPESLISESMLICFVCLCVCLFVCLSTRIQPQFYLVLYQTLPIGWDPSRFETVKFASTKVKGQVHKKFAKIEKSLSFNIGRLQKIISQSNRMRFRPKLRVMGRMTICNRIQIGDLLS